MVKNQFATAFKAKMTKKGHTLLKTEDGAYLKANGKSVPSTVITYKLTHGFNKSYQYTKNAFWAIK